MPNERSAQLYSRPFSRPLGRLADRVGQLVLAGLILIVTAPFWLLWIAVLVVLCALRPLIVYPLGFAAFGALFAGVWFAATGAWLDAAQAGVAALIAGGLLAVYGAFFDRFKSDHLSKTSHPPWWWYF